jgi:hypothetical protein
MAFNESTPETGLSLQAAARGPRFHALPVGQQIARIIK